MKRFAGLICGLSAAFVLGGCGQKGDGNALWAQYDYDSEYVESKGNLVVGVTNFEPLDYLQDGKWIGFDAEMAELFGEHIGVVVEFVEIEWGKKEVLLNNGAIDCVWNGMTWSDEVGAAMACTEAYLNNAQIIVVPENSAAGLRTVEDCMHLLFAVEAGSTGEQKLNERKYRYTSVESQMNALENVISGRVDAAVIDAILAGALIGRGKQFETLSVVDSMSTEEYVIGFRKGSDLAEKLNAFLEESYVSGTLGAIAEKYGVQAALIPME